MTYDLGKGLLTTTGTLPKDPRAFGANFTEWARLVPNLQSVTMMQSMAAMAAEYHVHQVCNHRVTTV
jgi:hypothetical protein